MFHDLSEPHRSGLDADPAEPESVRQCMVILETQYDANGFIPSLVFEGEPGHFPMTGRGPLAAPWYWGKTLDAARAVCRQYNAEKYGLSEDDCHEIILSSMFPARSRQ